MNIADIAVTSLETITGFDPVSGAYLFTLDELQNASIQNSQETQDITGKGGRLLSTLKRNKTVTITGANGLVSGGLLEVQTGGTFESKTADVMWTDYLTVNSHAATTNYKAIGTAGAEIEELFIRNADGTKGDSLEQDTTAAAGKFAYAPATKALSFHTDVADGTEIVVIYKRRLATAGVIENVSDVYSKKATLYIDAFGEDKCGNVSRIQFFIPKADFSGEFTIDLGDNQTVHNFEARSLAGACVGGNSAMLWSFTIFGADTADAA